MKVHALFATLVSPVVLYFIVRAAAVNTVPTTAAALPPRDYSSALTPLVAAAVLPQSKPDQRLLALADQAMVAAPMWHGAFILRAKTAEQAGQIEKAVLLLEEARRRRPKFVPTRLLLIMHYTRLGRYAELLSDIDFTLQYSAETRRLLLPELAKRLSNPETRAALATMLADNPAWKSDFFRTAKAIKVAPEDALALLKLRAPTGENLSDERDLYIQSLLDAGRAQQARELWLEALPATAREQNAFLFNGTFQPSTGRAPFDWKLYDNEVGRAEIVRAGRGRGYLDVNYMGSRAAVLAEQKVALAPGKYSLSVSAELDGEIKSGNLFWAISCASGLERLRLGITSAGLASRTVRGAFDVPGGCASQTLQLVGEPGEMAAPINVKVTRLEVLREA